MPAPAPCPSSPPPTIEAPTDAGGNNVYDVTVQVSDGTFTDTQAIAVTVTNVNDNPPVISSNGGGATAARQRRREHHRGHHGDRHRRRCRRHAHLFHRRRRRCRQASPSIPLTGALSFVSAPNYETPTDAGGNNVYDVTVQVSDGTFTDTQDIAVTVTNVNDNPPVISSNGGGATAAVSVAENTTAVTTVTATDADAGATLTYSIVGGADAASFTINPAHRRPVLRLRPQL